MGARARRSTSTAARPAGARSTTTSTPTPRRRGGTPRRRSTAMDAEGLDLAVLFPSRGLFVLGLDSRRADRPRRARAGVRHRHRPCVQRLDEGLLRRRARPHVRRGHGRAARRRRRGRSRRVAAWRSSASRRSSSRPATVNRRPWHHPAYDPLWAEIERLDVPIAFHGGGQTYLTPDFSLEVLDRADAVAHVQPAARHPVRHRVLLRRRRARAVPRPAGRAARGQLLVGAVAPLPARRALRVDRLVRGARPHDEAVGVLPAQLLDLGRGRRGDRAALHRHVRRRQAGLLDRLPPRRLEVPARGRRLRQAAR